MAKINFSLFLIAVLAGFIQKATSNVIGARNGLGCGNNLGKGSAFGNRLAPTSIGNIGSLGLPAGPGLAGMSNGATAAGYGDVSILGELPVSGSTSVSGNVPVIGYVTFEGIVPAGGIVSVAPGCECNKLAC